MLEFSSQPRLPSSYRLVLAISLALFAHSLVGAGVVLLLPDPSRPDQIKLEITLVAPGNRASQANQPASRTSQLPISRQIRPEEIRTTAPSHASAQEPEKREVPPKKPGEKQPERPPPPRVAKAQAAEAASQGRPSPIEGGETAEVSQIAKLDRPTALPYVQQLATKIAAEMARSGVALPKGADRFRAETVKLDLRLLGNGALVNAEIVESSGNERLDQSYLRAALRASPFARPPDSDRSGGFRYQVKLLYEPGDSG